VRVKTAVAVHEGAVQEAVAALQRVRSQALEHAGRTARRLLESRRAGLMDLRKVSQADVAAAEARKVDLRKREAELQQRLVSIPPTEAALGPLHRTLDESAKVLAIRQQDAAAARAAVEFYTCGDCSDVTRFRVDAWATVPIHPTGPARWRYLAGALLLGTLLGYGLFLLRRHLEGRQVEAVDDVADLYPNAVVVEVPDLGARRRRLPTAGDVLMTGYVLGCVALCVVAVAVQRGWTDGPGWVVKLVQG